MPTQPRFQGGQSRCSTPSAIKAASVKAEVGEHCLAVPARVDGSAQCWHRLAIVLALEIENQVAAQYTVAQSVITTSTLQWAWVISALDTEDFHQRAPQPSRCL